MAEQEVQIGKAKMVESPSKGAAFVIKENAVKTKHVDNGAITEPKVDPALLASLRAIDDIPTANSNNPVKSGGVKSSMDTLAANKQDTIEDLNTIRSNAQTGSIGIKNIRNLMNACNEVFRIGFIGYHIDMSDNPNENGDYTFRVLMNENT